jgi:hypothetical protein
VAQALEQARGGMQRLQDLALDPRPGRALRGEADAQPLERLVRIPAHTFSGVIHLAEIELSVCLAALGRGSEQSDGVDRVLRHPLSVPVHETEAVSVRTSPSAPLNISTARRVHSRYAVA